ncbi:hypothetical protein ACFQVA_01750 [Actinomadura keratinilytica]
MVKIDFIYAIPSIFSGAKISISLAVGGAVVGEFIAARRGSGTSSSSPTARWTCRRCSRPSSSSRPSP